MYKWFTESGEHIFWSQICNNVSYVANHDSCHKVIITNTPSDTKQTIVISLLSYTHPYEEVHYYGEMLYPKPADLYDITFKESAGAVQTALSFREYSSLTRCNPNLIIRDLKNSFIKSIFK